MSIFPLLVKPYDLCERKLSYAAIVDLFQVFLTRCSTQSEIFEPSPSQATAGSGHSIFDLSPRPQVLATNGSARKSGIKGARIRDIFIIRNLEQNKKKIVLRQGTFLSRSIPIHNITWSLKLILRMSQIVRNACDCEVARRRFFALLFSAQTFSMTVG